MGQENYGDLMENYGRIMGEWLDKLLRNYAKIMGELRKI